MFVYVGGDARHLSNSFLLFNYASEFVITPVFSVIVVMWAVLVVRVVAEIVLKSVLNVCK